MQDSAARAGQLEELFAAHGVAADFITYDGRRQSIPQQHRLAVLALQGVNLLNDTSTTETAEVDATALDLAVKKLHRQQSRLAPVHALTLGPNGLHGCIKLRIPAARIEQEITLRIRAEDGKVSVKRINPLESPVSENTELGVVDVSVDLADLQLPCGYHRLTIVGEQGTDSLLVIAPQQAWVPDCLRQEMTASRIWGVSVQLYTLCTSRSWGMGDFSDLSQLLHILSAQGADFVVLNPLHAGPLHMPQQCSPYSPTDRRRLNPLYIDPEQEPEFESISARPGEVTDNPGDSSVQTDEAWISYESVAERKLSALAAMYQVFKDQQIESATERSESFRTFTVDAGESLQAYAHWQAQRPPIWAAEAGSDPQFYCYLQWLAESQLDKCQQLALSLGMKLGLIRDLAVGSDREGAEVTQLPGLFSARASIGAPPDPLAPQGQNWGLPPMDPFQLLYSGCAHYIELLRQNMRHSGALRIDHVMSLMRLWWCAEGDREKPDEPEAGAYVYYPVEIMFAILRLESQRQQCLVIGEDLGVVPPEVRTHLSSSAIFSNLLFYFEKSDSSHYRAPEHYKATALAMLANHDVPTLKAWWNGTDIHLREQLGLFAETHEKDEMLQQRMHDRQQICALLEGQWLLPANRFAADGPQTEMDTELHQALLRCLGRSQSQLVSVQLDDLCGMDTPVNVPGTCDQYPNWRRKLPVDALQSLKSETVVSLLESLRVERS